jgi:GNAT superfamily N-acetyltransferase
MGNKPSYTYIAADPMGFTDDEIREGVDLANELSAEVLPDDPPTPYDQAIEAHRSRPRRIRRTAVRVRDANGALVASTGIAIDPDHDDNPDLLSVGINVVAGHRNNGIATQLLAYVVALAKREGRTRLICGTSSRLPGGEGFVQSLGAVKKQATHMNRLLISDVDRALMEQWVADGPVRAEGYELIGWDGHVPDEHMDDFLAAILVMNTAPRDDLEVNDFTVTAEEIREQEKVVDAAGYEEWQLIARRTSDGAWAGIHDVGWNPSEPDYVYVGSTGVFPEHRGHALGKWLKAAMTLRVMDERPNVTEIRTGNADSNDAMLGINTLMGYKPFIDQATWELSTAQAEAWLDKRGVALPEV